MGELAASIAHEVNQPIAGVVLNGNASLRWLARVKEESIDLQEARDGHAAHITAVALERRDASAGS
jgi:C4-dicarboxylate-specific signal transduction histidine kinase